MIESTLVRSEEQNVIRILTVDMLDLIVVDVEIVLVWRLNLVDNPSVVFRLVLVAHNSLT